MSLEEKLIYLNKLAVNCPKDLLDYNQLNLVYYVIDGGLDPSRILDGRCSIKETIEFSMKDFEDKVDWYIQQISTFYCWNP